MSCTKKAICFYAKGHSIPPVSPAVLQVDSQRFCEGNYSTCAVFAVMDKIGFLKAPKDLKPADVGRVASLLA